MFSPAEASSQSQLSSAPASTRNPRRRQRDSHDSISIRQPVRKRSKLSEETFAEPSRTVSGATKGANGDVDSHGKHGYPMPMRERERLDTKNRRGGRLDTSTVLTKTSAYIAKALPAFPERLKDGEIGTSPGGMLLEH